MLDEYTYLLTGDKLEDLTIKTLEQGVYCTGEGYVLLINFFTMDCLHCKKMLEYLEESIWPALVDKNVRMVSIGRGHTDKEVAAYREEGNYNFAFAADEDRSVYSRFAEKKIPRNYLFDADGVMVYQTRGFHPDQMISLSTVLRELIL